MTGDDQPHLTAPSLSAPLFLVVPDRRSPCHSQTSQPQPIVARLVLKLRALAQCRWTGRLGLNLMDYSMGGVTSEELALIYIDETSKQETDHDPQRRDRSSRSA